MVAFLVNWLTENSIPHFVDEYYNVYATKQESSELPEDFYFPCVISHTDTVHNIDTINIREEMLMNAQGEKKLSYKAYNDQGNPTGIGGDDKCGVFACLTLLQELPNVKAAFFVSEETGCHGSMKADKKFNLMHLKTGWLQKGVMDKFCLTEILNSLKCVIKLSQKIWMRISVNIWFTLTPMFMH